MRSGRNGHLTDEQRAEVARRLTTPDWNPVEHGPAPRLRAVERELETPTGTPEARRRVRLTTASQVEPERVRWALRDRVPLGHLTLLAGQPKLGKSTWALDLAARLSQGEADGDLHGEPADAVILSYEDHHRATLVPRLLAAGAELDRVHLLSPTAIEPDGTPDLVTLTTDLECVAAECVLMRARLLVVDPLMASLAGSTDAHRDQDIRRALAPLAQLAERLVMAVLVVSHTTKARDGDMIRRIGASVGLSGAARSLLVMGPDPGDPAGADGAGRVLVQRGNLSGRVPALAYRVEPVTVEHGSEAIKTSRLALVGETDVQAHDLLAPPEPEDRTETDIACEWLADYLGDGASHARSEVSASAEQEGLSPKVLRSARERLGVEVDRRGMPARSYWRLSAVPSPPARQGTAREGMTEDSKSQSKIAPPEPPVVPSESARARPGTVPGGGPPCRYLAHRASDYIGESGATVCGVCHPPPGGLP